MPDNQSGRFESEFADYLGIEHAAAVPHGTSALHLATLALDIGPGDEVVVPESTWVATAAPIVLRGRNPRVRRRRPPNLVHGSRAHLEKSLSTANQGSHHRRPVWRCT